MFKNTVALGGLVRHLKTLDNAKIKINLDSGRGHAIAVPTSNESDQSHIYVRVRKSGKNSSLWSQISGKRKAETQQARNAIAHALEGIRGDNKHSNAVRNEIADLEALVGTNIRASQLVDAIENLLAAYNTKKHPFKPFHQIGPLVIKNQSKHIETRNAWTQDHKSDLILHFTSSLIAAAKWKTTIPSYIKFLAKNDRKSLSKIEKFIRHWGRETRSLKAGKISELEMALGLKGLTNVIRDISSALSAVRRDQDIDKLLDQLTTRDPLEEIDNILLPLHSEFTKPLHRDAKKSRHAAEKAIDDILRPLV